MKCSQHSYFPLTRAWHKTHLLLFDTIRICSVQHHVYHFPLSHSFWKRDGGTTKAINYSRRRRARREGASTSLFLIGLFRIRGIKVREMSQAVAKLTPVPARCQYVSWKRVARHRFFVKWQVTFQKVIALRICRWLSSQLCFCVCLFVCLSICLYFAGNIGYLC